MADYTAIARTNYFRVKDLDALRAELKSYGLEPGGWDSSRDGMILDAEPTNKPEGAIAFFCNGTWPSLDEDSTADRLVDDADAELPDAGDERLLELIGRHLVDTDVAVFLEIGNEKMRYLGGSATAINARGEVRTVNLESIYSLAAAEIGTPGTTVTHASY